MRNLVAIVLALLLPVLAAAQEWEDRQIFNADAEGTRLRILSSTDTELFAPIIAGFVAANRDISVEYFVTGTADLDRRFRADPAGFDIAVSSAMDLQLKLANDGFAARLPGVTAPGWAEWRQSLFAFTLEPAAIVLNRAAFAGQPLPRSRQDLIAALRARPEAFRGRVGTYDVRASGLGFLFATQDARASETFWRLMEVMGGLDARLYCCSGEMIDDLISGRIAVAYNVLGSYAQARTDGAEALEIVLPADFPTTMMRTALVSAEAPAPRTAEGFVRHLLDWAATPGDGGLPPLGAAGTASTQATIPLEPALLTFLDALKREKFLSEWESALIQR